MEPTGIQDIPEFIIARNDPLHSQVAQTLLNRNKFLTMYDTEGIYIYVNGYFQENAEPKIKEKIQKSLGEHTTISIVSETIQYIKRLTYVEREKTESQPNRYLNLKNGVYDLKTKQLIEHNPEFGFTYQIPYDYNPEQKNCPKIRKFLEEVVGKEYVSTCFEMIAYCLWRENTLQKAFMLVGSGSNGKSVLLNVITAFLGNENVSAMELQTLEEDRFSVAGLVGKHANICADLPNRSMKSSGMFKSIVGNDRIRGEQKYKNQFFFKPFAKLIFSANMVPRPEDDTDAFFRRWVVLTFPNKFEGKTDKKTLVKELTSKDEMEGLLFRSIKLLPTLIKRGFISNAQTTEDVRKTYMRLSDPIGSFLADCIVSESGSKIVKAQLYQKFQEYCKEHKYPIASEKTFSTVLKKSMLVGEAYITEYVDNSDSRKQVWHWEGIAFNPLMDRPIGNEATLSEKLVLVFG